MTLPYLDDARISVLGVCGGGGYAINATLTEKRINAVVSITGVNIGRLFRECFSQYDPLGALDAMAAQRTMEARGSELLPASPQVATQNWLTERDVFEATDYYIPRAASSLAAPPTCFSATPRRRWPRTPSPSPRRC